MGALESTPAMRLQRLDTGIPGLDEILRGGLLEGGANLLVGPPGAGKTIFGAQIAVHHARSRGKAVFVTVLSEPHERLIQNLRAMEFFEERLLPDALYFVSGYRELERDGPDGLLALIQGVVRERRASLVVVDGFAFLAGQTTTALQLQKFVYELSARLSAAGCTALLLSTGGASTAEDAVAETVISLDTRPVALRAVREVRVTKFRGSAFLEGAHPFVIRSDGVTVFPRLEALATRGVSLDKGSGVETLGSDEDDETPRAGFGIDELDRMLHGGVPRGTTTTLLGAPGSGKTVLGTTFLARGAERGERVLYFGFYEPPPRLAAKMRGLGIDLRSHERAGNLLAIWQPPVERLLDSLAARLLEAVRRHHAARVFVDGVDGFEQVAADPGRLPAFFTALSEELRGLGVTTVLSEETDLFRAEVIVPLHGISATVDNILFLRYVELRGELRRLLSVLKLRDSVYDSSLREFRITEAGFDIEPTFESAEMVMTGVAREARGLGPELAAGRRASARRGGKRKRR